jgi:peroxiredoxin
MNLPVQHHLAAFAVAMILATSAAAVQAQEPVCDPSLGQARLDFTLKTLDGKDVSLSAYSGKLLLLNFWATWCLPCKVEIPGLIDLYNRYRRDGLEILGIAVDEPASTVAPYASAIKMNYPVLLEVGHEVHEAFNIPGLPSTIIVNRDGNICSRHVGFTRKASFETAIERLLRPR